MMFFAHLKYSHVCQLSFVCVVTSLVELLHSAFSSNFGTCIFCLGKNLTLPVNKDRAEAIMITWTIFTWVKQIYTPPK